jgi:hypothetical protein
MADLPDIDTSDVSFIAFFNAIDQGGVQDTDPTEVTSHGNVQSYTLYDNGVEGVYTTVTGRDCAFRVKEDGWFVAWFNRYENYNNGENTNPDDLRGPWDLLNDWADYTGGPDDITTNSLERCINALKNELSNSGSVTYSASDVGLYDYRYSSAAGITGLSYHDIAQNGNNFTNYPGLQYTSGTTVHWAAATSTVHAQYVSDDGGVCDIDFEGTDITYVHNEDDSNSYAGTAQTHHGNIDLISRGLIPDTDTEYTGSAYHNSHNAGDIYGNLNCLLVWE